MSNVQLNQLIERIVRYNQNHLTRDELYIGVRLVNSGIDKKQFSEKLNSLIRKGRIVEFDFNGRIYLDYDAKLHFHEYCPICKNLKNCEYDFKVLAILQAEMQRKIKTRNLINSDLIFNGICDNCRNINGK
ncbi:MAG: hypothetical protein IKD09_05075 [Lentisphaeria bacterium]|nr:hypothetical protein [Lentisphaeria bacterium]